MWGLQVRRIRRGMCHLLDVKLRREDVRLGRYVEIVDRLIHRKRLVRLVRSRYVIEHDHLILQLILVLNLVRYVLLWLRRGFSLNVKATTLNGGEELEIDLSCGCSAG